jgi:hypothetical protein
MILSKKGGIALLGIPRAQRTVGSSQDMIRELMTVTVICPNIEGIEITVDLVVVIYVMLMK